MRRPVLCGAVAMIMATAPHSLAAQVRPPEVSATAPLDSQYVGALSTLHRKVVALAEAIPADRYGWKPSDEVRTVSQVLMHMAGEWFVLCPRSVGAAPPAAFTNAREAMRALEATEDKTQVLHQLERSWEYCRAALHDIRPERLVPDSLPARMGFPRTVLLVMADQHEHLGQLIAYARSLGVTPPWSH